MKESMETLHYQETALVLILQALGQLTKKEQRVELKQERVVQTLERAKRPSLSIFGICGDARSSVRFSYTSETAERLSAIFTFDMEVMASTAYRNAFTALLKRNITTKDGDRNSSITLTPVDTSFDKEALEDDGIGIAISAEPTKERDNESPMVEEEMPLVRAATTNNVGVQTLAAGMFCRALYDYDEPDDLGSLIFEEGDIIQIITQLESGWWDGVLRGVRGWFPSNYCAVITPELFSIEVDHGDYKDDSSSDDESGQERTLDDGSKSEIAFWVPQATPDGRLFYFNTLTGVSTMELPLGEM